MEKGDDGGGGISSSSCRNSGLVPFGENIYGFCPLMMAYSQANPDTGSALFLHPPSASNCTQDLNRDISAGGGVLIPGENQNSGNNNTSTGYYFMKSTADPGISSARAKIMAHPHYHRLLTAYVNCQKIGAPPDVVVKLEEARSSAVGMSRQETGRVGEDPALDQFMEAYCEMLTKCEQEISKPFKEAMLFLSRVECQFKALTVAPSTPATVRNGSSEKGVNANNSVVINHEAEEKELKGQLLQKYSGYLGSLKQEFMKKRKRGKLPKEARQQLLDWWSTHYKWPYPSESQKMALAASTGLDQKQINNWFINQRKRHWKPSEDMQFIVMDPYYCTDMLGNPFPMDISPAFL